MTSRPPRTRASAGRSTKPDPGPHFTANRWRARLIGLLVMVVLTLIAGWLDGRGSPDRPNQRGTRERTQSTYALHGQVVKVADGDTVTLSSAQGLQRIRLASIDAPETGDQARPGQPYGEAARKYLASLVDGRTLTARCYEQDHYQRHVCDLLLADGQIANQTANQTVNRRLVEAGLAWANQQGRGRYLRDKTLLELQRQARQARRGLWQAKQGQPISPWQWRQQCWQQKRCG